MTKLMKSFFQIAIVVAALAFNGAAVAQDSISKADKAFLKDASELGLLEVEMGKLGAQKATDPALRDFAGQLVKDHTKSNQELMALAQRKGVELPAEPNPGQRRKVQKFIGKSGSEFDSEFREHAVKDHEKGIRLFQEAARDSKDGDIQAFASKQLSGMQKHLAMVKGEGHMRTTRRGEDTPAINSNAPGRASAPVSGRVKTP